MRYYTTLALALLFASGLSAQLTYSGIFKKADTDYEYAHKVSWEELQQRNAELDARGFHLIDIETARAGKGRYYWGIWKKEGIKARLMQIPGWDSLVVMKRSMAAGAFVMNDIEGYTEGGKEFYLAIWTPGTDEHKVRKLTSWEGLSNDHDELIRRGLRMVDVEGFEAGDGTTHYLAIYHWRVSSDKTHLHRSPEFKSFMTDKIYRHKSGYRLFDYEHFEKRGTAFFFGLYQKEDEGGHLENRLNWQDFQEKTRQLREEEGTVLMDIDINSEGEEQ